MTILITGANRGIGKGLADEWREAGEHVIGTARSEPGMEVLDVADPASVTSNELSKQEEGELSKGGALTRIDGEFTFRAAIPIVYRCQPILNEPAAYNAASELVDTMNQIFTVRL